MLDSHRFAIATLLLQVSLGGAYAEDRLVPTPGDNSQLDPLDSRRWSQAGNAILKTDLSLVRPASALVHDKRREEKWKVIPYATKSFDGQSLSAYAETNAPTVSLPLQVSGWHAVYVGVGSVSNGIVETTNVVRAKLSGHQVFKRMSNHQHVRYTNDRRDSIEEVLLTVADLTGQSRQTSFSTCRHICTQSLSNHPNSWMRLLRGAKVTTQNACWCYGVQDESMIPKAYSLTVDYDVSEAGSKRHH